MSDSPREYALFLNGEMTAASSGKLFTRRNPANGEPVVCHQMATSADAVAAINIARHAFDNGPWPTMDSIHRADVLRRFADILMANQEQLGTLESLITGSPIQYARSFIDSAAEVFRFYAGLARDIHGRSYNFHAGNTGFTLKEPIGVVSLIVPWNFPIGEVCWKLAPALAAGCTVVVKPDSKTAATALEFGALLKQAGLPDGVYNVVTGDVEDVGDVLTGHELIDSVSFTGSTDSGSKVMASAAGSMKPLHLELGGKSPMIVMADADLDQAARDACSAIFWHNGQVCTASSRILVNARVAEAFTDKLCDQAAAILLGDPSDVSTEQGPVISMAHRDRIQRYIALGAEEGAVLRYGGEAPADPKLAAGAYILPTVFTQVDPGMRIAQEEIFGPVVCIMSFDTLDEAINIANATHFGLGAGVWTKNLDTALQVIRRVKSGNLWVNGWGACRSELPWGGCKKSGFGRELGHEALEHFLTVKSVHIAHSPTC